ncbi:MAG: DUF1833 family protein [Acidaminococcaceae bacterium]|nr:DUF1833 family protein [Acidaminococcaceae bacterium]MBR1661579.1 DUF1833 family protein [Acidaminococcaceae bacterium]
MDLSTAAILEKNKVSTDGVWLELVTITYGSEEPIRLVANNENINFMGNTYYKFPFDFSSVKESSSELPSTNLSVSNATGAIQQIVEQYNGVTGADVCVQVINTNTGNEIVAEENFKITGVSTDNNNIVFRLGTDFALTRRFPSTRILKDFCPFKYKGTECGYSGTLASCKKTLTDCRNHGNSERFGGEPTIPQGGLYART